MHRDVKPANMLLHAWSGRPDHVYLSDFGLSKEALGATGLTAANQFLGTVDYAAPEQVTGKAVGGAADQYALGCAAYEMLAGEPPFRRDQAMALLYAHMSEPPAPVSSRRPGLPAALDPVFDRVLAKSPADRYPSCAAFTSALRQAVGLAPYDAAEQASRPATEVARSAGPVTPPTEAAGQPAWATPAPGPHVPVDQPYIPGLYPGQYEPATAPRRERRWPLIALSALGTAAVVAIAYSLVLLASHKSTNNSLAGGSPPPATGTTPPPATPTPSPTISSPDGTPYTDAEGFSVRLPAGRRIAGLPVRGTTQRFTSPARQPGSTWRFPGAGSPPQARWAPGSN